MEETPSSLLTRREIEILTRASEGLSSKQIAERLHLSKRTVDFHLGNAYEKLGVSSRLQAIQEAMRRGLLPRG